MKKALVKLAVVFAAFVIAAGFAPNEVYAKQGKCIATGCSSSCSKASWYCYEHECKKSGCYNKGTHQGIDVAGIIYRLELRSIYAK